MANGDQELQKVKDAVCLIVGETRDEEGNPVPYKGTGFYFGGGWIMTVAHNFQDEHERSKTTHSIMSEARFRVEFHIEGKEYVFREQKRMAFIHHLKSGYDTDFKNKDIAMVKLGHQWNYDRKDYPHWEIEEHKNLEAIDAHYFALAKIDVPEPKLSETVYAVHYGGDDNDKKTSTSGEIYIRGITSASTHYVSMLHLKKKMGVLPAGSSGCPIMVKRGVKYYLVGLHFSGDDDDHDGDDDDDDDGDGAEALQWNQGIHDYIKKGVGIIAVIGDYMKTRAPVSRDKLEKMAREENLTIYLCNDDVINQQ